MTISKKDAYLAAVRSDLAVFVRQSFATIFPGKEYMANWHHAAILHCLRLSIEGKMPRLILNMPPRMLKSFLATVALPAFVLGLDPTAKFICISYSDELAKTHTRDFRRIIESDWYRLIFPHVQAIKMTENEFATDMGGTRYATSIGATLTGRGGDFIVIDDPLKPEEARSDKMRESVNEWFRSTLLSRLDDKQRSVLIVIMQRLHTNDLAGFIEAGGGFHKLALSAIAITDEYISINDDETYFRRAGEALHEEREGVDLLHKIHDQVGPYNFASQYQQRPEAPEGALFKRHWFKVIDRLPARREEGAFHVSIDTALSMADTADYSAISIVYGDRTGYYVLFAERGRWDFDELRQKALTYVHRFGEDVIFLVEAAGTGISLISYLRRTGVTCFHYVPRDGKLVRAAFALPTVYSGRVHIVAEEGCNTDWVEPYLAEFAVFPSGPYDDQVDSLVQLVNWAERRFNPAGRIDVSEPSSTLSDFISTRC
jgi:predicted phage terminase large subunit-like protein